MFDLKELLYKTPVYGKGSNTDHLDLLDIMSLKRF